MEKYQCTAAQLADDKRPKIVADLRSRAFYEKGSWPGAVNYPMDDEAEMEKSLFSLDQAKPVYLICYTGMTADEYAEQLQKKGFEAYSIEDGWRGCMLWQMQQA